MSDLDDVILLDSIFKTVNDQNQFKLYRWLAMRVSTILLLTLNPMMQGLVFEHNQYSVVESEERFMVCTVAPSPPLGEDVQFVIVDDSGTALRGEDYHPLGEFGVIPNNSYCIDLATFIIDDSTVESTEQFTLIFIANDTIGTRDSATVYITDNDGARIRLLNQLNGIAFGAGLFAVTESNMNTSLPVCAELVEGGDAGMRRFSSGLEREAVLLITTMEKLAGSSDFQAVSNKTLTLPIGSTNTSGPECEYITIIGDIVPEPAELFTITVITENSLDVIEGPNTSIVVIQNDDPTPDCGQPSSPGTRGLVTFNSTLLGYTALYSCDNGYRLEPADQETRMCLLNGNWSGVDPSCMIVDCGLLPSPQFGVVLLNQTSFGATALYSCSRGYWLLGNNSRTCLANGLWSNIQPTCQAVNCGVLIAPVNGVLNMRSSTFNSTVNYSCTVGHQLVGDQTRTCLASGNWSGSQPLCQVVECGPLVPPAQGHVTVNFTTFLSIASYSCDPGYTNSTDLIRECQSSGRWSGLAPDCIDVNECESPTLCNRNAKCVNTLGGFNCSCLTGFTGDGLSCDDINECAMNSTNCSQGCLNTVGSYQCVCLDGYLLAKDNITCINVNECEEGIHGCHANAECTDTVGSFNCSCREGFCGNGLNCTVVDCGLLPSPQFGVVLLNQTSFGATALYSCLRGYQLLGDNSRTCLANGLWSNNQPICQVIDCGGLSPPANGIVTLSNSNLVDSVAAYSCNRGYNVVGVVTRVCQLSGEWSGLQPVCQSIDCGPLPNITMGTVSLLNGSTEYQSVAMYECVTGYRLVSGDQSRICLITREWSGVSPSCSRIINGTDTIGLAPNKEDDVDIAVLAASVSVSGFAVAVIVVSVILLIAVRRTLKKRRERVFGLNTRGSKWTRNVEPVSLRYVRPIYDTFNRDFSLSLNDLDSGAEFPLSAGCRPTYANLHCNIQPEID